MMRVLLRMTPLCVCSLLCVAIIKIKSLNIIRGLFLYFVTYTSATVIQAVIVFPLMYYVCLNKNLLAFSKNMFGMFENFRKNHILFMKLMNNYLDRSLFNGVFNLVQVRFKNKRYFN